VLDVGVGDRGDEDVGEGGQDIVPQGAFVEGEAALALGGRVDRQSPA